MRQAYGHLLQRVTGSMAQIEAQRDAASVADATRKKRGSGCQWYACVTELHRFDTGNATTDGIVVMKDSIAQTDSPLVASMRCAGAIIVGRSDTPAFSLRWFTDNALLGRTLNPFDPAVTPGPLKVAVFKQNPVFDADPSVVAAIDSAPR
mgnify:CR=1 FL=1